MTRLWLVHKGDGRRGLDASPRDAHGRGVFSRLRQLRGMQTTTGGDGGVTSSPVRPRGDSLDLAAFARSGHVFLFLFRQKDGFTFLRVNRTSKNIKSCR